jgi:hypothetical protein
MAALYPPQMGFVEGEKLQVALGVEQRMLGFLRVVVLVEWLEYDSCGVPPYQQQ